MPARTTSTPRSESVPDERPARDGRSAKGGRTRERLVAAARTLLSDAQAGEFTTRNVAALCQVSPSLTHYHFKDRTELIVAVVEDLRTDWILPVEQAVAEPGTFAERADRVLELLVEPESADVGRLYSALHWFAQTDERIRVALAAEYRRWAAAFVDLFQVLADERGGTIDPVPLGLALAAASDGVAATQSLGIDVDARAVLSATLAGLSATAPS